MFTADNARKFIENANNAVVDQIEDAIKIAAAELKTEALFRFPPEMSKQQAEKIGVIFSSAPRNYKVRVSGIASANYGSVEYYAIILSW